jgi:hypothetical protein
MGTLQCHLNGVLVNSESHRVVAIARRKSHVTHPKFSWDVYHNPQRLVRWGEKSHVMSTDADVDAPQQPFGGALLPFAYTYSAKKKSNVIKAAKNEKTQPPVCRKCTVLSKFTGFVTRERTSVE